MKLKYMKRGIAYKTGVDCIGKRKGYFLFHNRIMNTYGSVKDTGQLDIYPPYCDSYCLESLINLIEKES